MEISLNSKLFAQIINISNPEDCLSDLIISEYCDILGFRFTSDEIDLDIINNISEKFSDKKLLFIGTGDDVTDKILIPKIADNIGIKGCIFGNINDKTYKDILPAIIKGKHYAILKTPIDINLAKELNILSVEMDLPPEKIIMNTDIGGLGYGYEYGFSIMEKIKPEREKDKYLSFPLFSDASSEALKTKEAKFDDFPSSWGNLRQRARMIELSACAGVIAAGANIITVNFPENIKILKGLV